MYEQAAVLGLYAETPLHPGSGSTVGAIDLPVQRERFLDFPLIPGSSLKGVLRSFASERWGRASPLTEAVFGPDTQRASDYGGALTLTDAHLLLFPVRSLYGVFAWITCPLALERYRRDLAAAGMGVSWREPTAQIEKALVAAEGCDVDGPNGGGVTLEEYTFDAVKNPAVAQIAEDLAANLLPASEEYAPFRSRLPRQLVLLTDDDFRDFVQTSTEVVARIKVDEATGTAASRGLWYEENLPPETVFYALALATAVRRQPDGADTPRSAADVLAAIEGLGLDRLQIGGNETVGRGIVKLRWRRAEGAPT